MIGASALIAVTSLIAKSLGLGHNGPPLHPLQITAGRFVFACACLLLIAPWAKPSFAGAAWRLHAVRSFFGCAGVACLFAATTQIPLADATAISFLSPLMTMAAAALLLGDRITPLRWLATGVSLSGAMLLIRPGTDAFHPGALIALAAACLMGLEAVFIKRLSDSEPPLRILLINNVIGTILATSMALLVWVMPNALQLLLLLLLGGTMLAAQSLFILALRGSEASFVIPFFYSTLLFAAIYDFLLFGDAPDGIGVLGALTIVAGSVLMVMRAQTGQQPRR